MEGAAAVGCIGEAGEMPLVAIGCGERLLACVLPCCCTLLVCGGGEKRPERCMVGDAADATATGADEGAPARGLPRKFGMGCIVGAPCDRLTAGGLDA